MLVILALGGLFFALRPAPLPSDAEPREREVNLQVRGNVMTLDEVALSEGDRATINITADRPIDLHLHGYDLVEEVSPGEPAEISFEADVTSRFGIEDEQSHTELGTLIVEPR
jgi:hypothetical protein